MVYTTSLGSWTYTLQPDGSITANGGAARATRIGAAPKQASLKPKEPEGQEEIGLKRAPPIIPANAIRTLQWQLADILIEMNKAAFKQWAVERRLEERKNDILATMEKAASEGRWRDVQRLIRPAKSLIAEYKAALAKN